MAARFWILWLAVLAVMSGCDGKPQQTQPDNVEAPEKIAETSVFARWTPWPGVQDLEPVAMAPDLTAENYYVILDCSGSMADTGCSRGQPKLQAAKQALGMFVNLVPGDANLGLLVFQDNRIQELVPLGRENRKQFIDSVSATRSGGGTPLRSAISLGYERLEEQGRKQLGYGGYTLVIVTDGEASEGQDPQTIVSTILDESPVQIHTIGFCIQANHSLNIPSRTVYKAADTPEALEKGLADVLAESEAFDVAGF